MSREKENKREWDSQGEFKCKKDGKRLSEKDCAIVRECECMCEIIIKGYAAIDAERVESR